MGTSSGSICLVPIINSIAGPGSFQKKLKVAFERRGIRVHHDPNEADTAAILIIAGTRRLPPLWDARRRGVRIVQRLNGINWVHRHRNLGLRYALRAELANLLLVYTRWFLADHVVYQSAFTRDWWHNWYGGHKAAYSVIHNGVDLQAYSPAGDEKPPTDHIRVQIVEGQLNPDNRLSLDNSIAFSRALEKASGKPVELVVIANIHPELRNEISKDSQGTRVTFVGVIPRQQVPMHSRAAHIQFSADINASCPNSVVEALACGLPVAAFDSGALPELVQGDAGVVVPYGANPWKLERPDFDTLAQAALPILSEQKRFRTAARALAEERFGLERMAESYLKALLGSTANNY